MTNYKFSFHCVDNGGKHQAFTVSAPNKAAAAGSLEALRNRGERQEGRGTANDFRELRPRSNYRF